MPPSFWFLALYLTLHLFLERQQPAPWKWGWAAGVGGLSIALYYAIFSPGKVAQIWLFATMAIQAGAFLLKRFIDFIRNDYQ